MGEPMSMPANIQVPAPLEDYFEALANDDLEGAAAAFTDDGVYYHPPNFRDEVVVEGQAELHEYFVENRGAKDIEHEILKVVTDGDGCGLVGRLTGGNIDGEDYFVSFAELEDGKISYYMAGLLKGNV